MGKQRPEYERGECSDDNAPICASTCCIGPDTDAKRPVIGRYDNNQKPQRQEPEEEIKELLVIGAGPHGLSLMLRLLEPDADFLSDKERHLQAEHRFRMRPDRDVMQHIRKLERGPRATLRPPSKKSKKKKKEKCTDSECCKEEIPAPPPLSLEEVLKSVLVVDKCGGWMSCWKENFESLGIPQLRSLMNAHADPFDHRTLEFYAESKRRGDELVTLPCLTQRDKDFKGPYQVPSTAIFNSFHELLPKAYGIDDAVCTCTVLSVTPTQGHDKGNDVSEPIFEVKIAYCDQATPGTSAQVKTVKAKRVVCAMGPMFRAKETFWEENLQKQIGPDKNFISERIMHAHEIVPFIKEAQKNKWNFEQKRKVLIVGGGITSAQLTLAAAKADWCDGATLIQRSRTVPRHFDIPNKYMGPRRGELLDDFWSLDMCCRAEHLKEARGGGTIPPELLQELQRCKNNPATRLEVKEEVEILEVNRAGGRLNVTLVDGSEEVCDMIWLAIGAENHIDYYSALSNLRETLPVSVVNGLPALNKDLTWRAPEGVESDEPEWKKLARERFWCMGALAGLELGPDALNLVGARHGSVKVAESVRRCFCSQKEKDAAEPHDEECDDGCC